MTLMRQHPVMLGLLGCLLLLCMNPAQAQNATATLTLEHDGIERRALLTIPDQPTAALIALHPLYSSPQALRALSGLDALADEQRFVIAYAQAAEPYWDDGRVAAELPPVAASVDDVGFLVALADSLRASYSVEDVYLVGTQTGGTMALRAACETPETFAGVAIIGALMWDYQTADCDAVAAETALDMLFITGESDHVYWVDGRVVNSNLTGAQWPIFSAAATRQHWARRNACDTVTLENSWAIFSGCTDDTITAMMVVPDGGAGWPRMADNRLNRHGVDATTAIGAFFSGDDWRSAAQSGTPDDRVPRSFILYVPPSYDPQTATPVVLALHGRHANAASQALSSGFNAVADEHGFIVVYPEAYDGNFTDPVWSYGRGVPMYGPLQNNDDLFLENLVDDLAQILNVDMTRLYVTGLSNGGLMTQRVACEGAQRYAAFAAVAATGPAGLTEICAGDAPVPLMLIHGDADTIMPWDGLVGRDPVTARPYYITAPMENTMGFWATHNGCDLEFELESIEGDDPDSETVIYRFQGCPDDAPLILYAVRGGGHVWPGVRDFESELLGEVNMDFNASEAMWDFFSQHTQP